VKLVLAASMPPVNVATPVNINVAPPVNITIPPPAEQIILIDESGQFLGVMQNQQAPTVPGNGIIWN